MPSPFDVQNDGKFLICVKISDQAGNEVISVSPPFYRETGSPSILSVSLNYSLQSGVLSLNKEERSGKIVTIRAENYTTLSYQLTLPHERCQDSSIYSKSNPTASDLVANTEYVVCVKAENKTKNKTSYWQSPTFRIEPQAVGVEHGSTAPHGKAIAVEVDDIDVRWPRRDAFFENRGTLVDQG